MEITVKEILEMKGALQELANEKLPVPISFKLGKLIKELNEHYDFISEQSQKIALKYLQEGQKSEVSESGEDVYTIPKENQADFSADMKELEKQTLEIHSEKIFLSDLDHLFLTPMEVTSLAPIIKE